MLYNVINEEHQKFCISTWHACSSIISDIYNKVDEATLLPIHSVLGWRKDGGKSSTTYELFPMVIVTPPSLSFCTFPYAKSLCTRILMLHCIQCILRENKTV